MDLGSQRLGSIARGKTVVSISTLGWMSLILIGSVTIVAVYYRVATELRERAMKRARAIFFLRREWLEAEFLKLAGLSGSPRGLRWVDCEFDNDVQFAKDRTSGQLRALVAATIGFEAIEGGDMEDVEAVGNLRAATTIFAFDGKKWTTSGRALFNLNPTEAIRHYQHELETVDLTS